MFSEAYIYIEGVETVGKTAECRFCRAATSGGGGGGAEAAAAAARILAFKMMTGGTRHKSRGYGFKKALEERNRLNRPRICLNIRDIS
jgi:hypothetical protein